MNMKEAKAQLKQTIQAYLARDDFGNLSIPQVAQRPLLLMGPPGIGKTAIAHQAAQECGIGIVAYTMTHHTRQSAIGLPSIQTGVFDGKEYKLTEYTMSEIIASVYQSMERTGLKSGILFLDEINCVSETLAPAMLQFLQCKTFGCHQLPEGWIVVAAGNPPEYNRSVRDFDIVTLDRVRRMDLEADYSVWKEYAYSRQVHNAILTYLDLKKDHFYQIETTVDGKRFVTARGWEDLSQFLQVCETLDLPVDESVIAQYLQHPAIAKDFTNYLYLYRKYQTDYDVPAILNGKYTPATVTKLRAAPFDERFSAVSLLLDGLFRSCGEANEEDAFVTELHGAMKDVLLQLKLGDTWALTTIISHYTDQLNQLKESGQPDKDKLRQTQRLLATLEEYQTRLTQKNLSEDPDASADALRGWFRKEVEQRKTAIETASAQLDHAFHFLEDVFGEGQELVIFVTELTMNPHASAFIRANGCELYHHYNRLLLLDGRQQELLDEIQSTQ